MCPRRASQRRQTYVVASITDLSRFDSGCFDVVLALGGPLSYCFDQAAVALAELERVAKPGGRLLLSVMNLFGTIHKALPGVLKIDASANERVLDSGRLTRDIGQGHECRLFRLEELRSLLEAAGLEDVDIQAPGWLTAVHDVELPPEGSPQWRFLLEAELRASKESPAAGTHLIAFAHAPLR